MYRKIFGIILGIMVVCALGAMAEGITVTDMYGREIVLDEPAKRIVVLTPSDCEILCALGCEDAIVGRGEFCNYPESILDKPVLQAGADINIEEILAAEPEIVVMSDMDESDGLLMMLEDNGIQAVISDAQDIAGTYVSIELMGALMGKDAEAAALIESMQAAFAELATAPSGKTVYFEVSPLEYGLWTAGANTFMDEIAQLCGLTNAFADVDGWAAVSEEQVLARDPDYIVTITVDYGYGPAPVDEIMSRAGWGDMKAIVNGNVYNADPEAVSRPSPRLAEAARELYEFVNGESAE